MKNKKKKKTTTSPINFLYSLDRDRVRVWRDEWAGDMFEIMAQNEFQQFRIFCNKFGFALTFQEED